MKRLFLGSLIMLATLCGLFFWTGQKAAALSQQFPDNTIFTPSTDSDHGYLEVSLLGGGNTLYAPQTAVNVLFTDPGLHSVFITDGRSCEAPLGGGVDFNETQASGSYTTYFRFWSNRVSGGTIARGNPIPNNGSCSNPDMTLTTTVGAADLVSFNGRQYYAIELRANAVGGNGGMVNAFKVTTEPNSYVVVPETTGLNGADGYFAIQRRPGQGSGDRTFALYMAPDCSLAPWDDGQQHQATFKFFDDDHGASFEINNPPSMKMQRADKGSSNWADIGLVGFNGLSGAGAGGWRSFTTANGGSGTFGDATFMSDATHKYRVLIQDVSGENGIRFALPFTEAGTIGGAQGSGCNTTPGGIQCRAAVANPNPVPINQNSAFTVNVLNGTNIALDGSYSLRQKYWSSINPAQQTLTRPLNPSPPGPGFIGPGANGNFQFNISRQLPGTFYFEFQMFRNGVVVGTPCPLLPLTVTDTPPRPDCYIRFRGGATNASTTLPYPGGPVTVDAQILNPGPTTWGNRYFMTEEHNGVRRNLGYLTSVVPGAFTANFPQNYSVSSTTTFNYQVWVVPGPPTGTVTDSDLAAFKAANPPPAIPNSPSTGIATGTMNCPITAYVAQPEVQGSIGGGLGADCKRIGYEVHWVPASGNPIRTIIRTMSGGQHDRDVTEAPGSHSFDPFTDPAFATVPIDQQVNYELFALNGDGAWISLGSVTIGPCLTPICNDSQDVVGIEPGETKTITDIGGFTIQNDTNRNENFTMSGSISGASLSPPNPSRSIVVPGSSNATYTIPASSITAGNTSFTITRTLTYQGRNINSCQQTETPSSRPYLKIFGGDVSAGGWFNNGNNSCASSNLVQQPSGSNTYSGGIRTFGSGPPAKPFRAGSSSEFAAYALGVIDSQTSGNGFYTWSLGGKLAQPPFAVTAMNALDFANTSPNGLLGFSSGAPTTVTDSCIRDYYSSVSGVSTAGDLNAKPAGGVGTSKIINKGTSSFSISGPWLFNAGERLTIYVEGDVYIKSNILYSNSVINPSYFSLIVKGNIYISSGVTTLEGLYIAQPDFGSGANGNIWTCSVGGAGGTLRAPGIGEIPANCRTKLTINGAVIAKHVTFNRIGDPNTNTLSRAANLEASSITDGPAANKSVEEINFIPEMVIGSPNLTSTNGNSSRLDAVTVLPPLF